jgi:hypothetical protein
MAFLECLLRPQQGGTNPILTGKELMVAIRGFCRDPKPDDETLKKYLRTNHPVLWKAATGRE